MGVGVGVSSRSLEIEIVLEVQAAPGGPLRRRQPRQESGHLARLHSSRERGITCVGLNRGRRGPRLCCVHDVAGLAS